MTCKFCEAGTTPDPAGACFKHCQKTPDGKHKLDPSSAQSTDTADMMDEDSFVIDVNCIECGQSGSATVALEDIYWD